uniref:Uncharacterized protein n=1 Tax=Cacopsylla melanoneura TaxID=428564 RepID=A0A8D8XH43_9HEMI
MSPPIVPSTKLYISRVFSIMPAIDLVPTVQIVNRKKNTSTSLYLSKCGLIIMLHLSSLCLSLQFESFIRQCIQFCSSTFFYHSVIPKLLPMSHFRGFTRSCFFRDGSQSSARSSSQLNADS